MNRKIFFALVAVSLAAAAVFTITSRRHAFYSKADDFARCLARKNITMYGADWCPHCENEKARFGSSFQFVPYVECPQNPQLCISKGIDGYPTWIFPDLSTSSGQVWRKLEGEQGLEKLSKESGCQLTHAKG